MNVVSSVFIVFRHVEVSESGRSLVQRSPTGCGVSECDREASIIRKPLFTRWCCAMEKKLTNVIIMTCKNSMCYCNTSFISKRAETLRISTISLNLLTL
jgi:hypothetical protein